MNIVKLSDKYRDLNITQSDAVDILWKKVDELVEACNFYEREIERLKQELKK